MTGSDSPFCGALSAAWMNELAVKKKRSSKRIASNFFSSFPPFIRVFLVHWILRHSPVPSRPRLRAEHTGSLPFGLWGRPLLRAIWALWSNPRNFKEASRWSDSVWLIHSSRRHQRFCARQIHADVRMTMSFPSRPAASLNFLVSMSQTGVSREGTEERTHIFHERKIVSLARDCCPGRQSQARYLHLYFVSNQSQRIPHERYKPFSFTHKTPFFFIPSSSDCPFIIRSFWTSPFGSTTGQTPGAAFSAWIRIPADIVGIIFLRLSQTIKKLLIELGMDLLNLIGKVEGLSAALFVSALAASIISGYIFLNSWVSPAMASWRFSFVLLMHKSS